MIKTDRHESEIEEAMPSLSLVIVMIILVVAVVVSSVLIVRHHSAPINTADALNQGNVQPLPLGTAFSAPLESVKSNQSTDNQSSNAAATLGSAGVNLQNGVPQAKTSTAAANNLQTTAGLTGQTINPALGF